MNEATQTPAARKCCTKLGSAQPTHAPCRGQCKSCGKGCTGNCNTEVHFTKPIDIPTVMAYENPEMVERYALRNGCSVERAQALFEETKRFLIVAVKCDGPVTPSTELDEMWHHFILHTPQYAEFCDRFFGGFVHHVPTEDSAEADLQPMLDLAWTLFGNAMQIPFWPGTPDIATIRSSKTH